jgi:amidase
LSTLDLPCPGDSRDRLCFAPLWRAVQWLQSGQTSAAELVDACEHAYRAANPTVNAMVVANFEGAHRAAAESDQRRRANAALGALDGIPFSIKESFDVQGWPTTCGSPAYATPCASQDAVVVERLRAQGAVLLGKTNVPLGLRDWQTYNALYGTTRNPRDPSRTPGGSSGGSAAAVCAGMSFFDIGSDIGSSLRNPAHYCGVFSHKSSLGIVPLTGHGTAAPGFAAQDINVAGPVARSAHDLESVLQAIAGPEADEALAYQLTLPRCAHAALSTFRVAVLPSHPFAEVDAEVSETIEALGRWLESQNAKVSWQARPDIDAVELWHVYILLLRATTSIYMDDTAFAATLDRADPSSTDHSYGALQFVGAGMHHRRWLQLQAARRRFARAWQRFFCDYDVLLCPAAATTAFPLNEAGEPWQRVLSVNGNPQPMTTQLFWAGYSGLCGLPSTMAPIGPGRSGLPVGVQIVAPRFGDLTSLRFAQLLESHGHAFQPPPAVTAPAQDVHGQ